MSTYAQSLHTPIPRVAREAAWFVLGAGVAFAVPFLGVSVFDLQQDVYFGLYFGHDGGISRRLGADGARPRGGVLPDSLEEQCGAGRARRRPGRRKRASRGSDRPAERRLLLVRAALARRQLRRHRRPAAHGLPVCRRLSAHAQPPKRARWASALRRPRTAADRAHHRRVPPRLPAVPRRRRAAAGDREHPHLYAGPGHREPARVGLAHVSMHVAAVAHSYETPTFLPAETKS